MSPGADADAPTFEPVDPDGTLFDVPRLRPPGSFYAIRRTDGRGLGMEEEYEWLDARHADDWAIARDIAEGLGEPVEFEMVLLVPTRVAVRTLGPAPSLRERAG
jgi:hypothetical protein